MDKISYWMLLVEKDEDDYLILRELLASMASIKFHLHRVETCEAARQFLARHRYDICLFGYAGDEAAAVDLVREFGEGKTPFILLSKNESEESAQATHVGTADILHKKQLDAPLLERSIRYAIERKKTAAALLRVRRIAEDNANNLKISEMRYRRLFESARDGILILDAVSGQIEDVNPYLCQLLGYEARELLGRQLWEIGAFSDIAASQDAFRELQAREYLRYDDLPLETKSGQSIAVEFICNIYVSGDKKVIQCHIRDITERKQMEGAKNFLASIVESSEDSILTINFDRVITSWNKAAEHLYGYTASEARGKHLTMLTLPKDFDQVLANIDKIKHSATVEIFDTVRLHKNGQEINLEVALSPVKNTKGQVIGVSTIARDITDRKRVEAQLVASEANLAKSQQMAHLGSWELDLTNLDDLNSNPLRWSDETFRIFGYEPRQIEVSNENFFRAVHPDDREFVNTATAHAIRDLKPYSIDHRVVLPDGTERIVHEQAEIVFDQSSGKPLKMVGTVQDITQQKQLEQRLRESEEHLRFVLDASNDGISWEWDIVSGKVTWSERIYTLLGLSPDSFEPHYESQRLLLHPDDVAPFERAIQAHLKTDKPFHIRLRCRRSNGTYLHILAQGRAQRDAGGRPLRMVGSFSDLTSLIQAEEERDRFFTLSLDMLAIIGSDGYMKRLNPAFEATLGFSNAEIMAVPFREFVHPDDLAATAKVMERLEHGIQVTQFENRVRCRSGDYKWLCWMAAPFEDLRYCVAHDITDEKQAAKALHKANDELERHVMERTAELSEVNESLRIENIEHQMTMETLRQVAQALQVAKEEADKANAAKSEFLSRMSHELRTPLNAILGFGQILEVQNLTARQKESVGYILKGGRHLLGLINEVLDIVRVEAGRFAMSLEPTALHEIVPEACDLVRPLAAERNIYLEESVSHLGVNYVLADPQRLKQVLINLLSNAIKYNREGGKVEVSCLQKPNGRLSIAVRDTGPGIAPEDLPKLFTPFERLGAANSQVEGTGLGLVLSQRLTSAMGGTLEVESSVAHGTTFTIELPRSSSLHEVMEESAEQTHDVLAIETGPRTCSVLCIEDNPSNLQLIEAIFEMRSQWSLLSAMQGTAGLDMARHHHPDLILLDLNLPDISGKEVLFELQQAASTREIPVIVISADATPGQVERLLSVGAKGYLTKPINVEQFLSTLDVLLQN